MPYHIDWLDKGLIVEFSGDVSIVDIDKASLEVSLDSRFRASLYQIFNLENADISNITLEQVRNTVRTDTDISSKNPNPDLVIVSNHPIADALVFHYKLYAEASNFKWHIIKFSNSVEALNWCKSIA